MKQVLVTGAAGFVGYHLIGQLCREGNRVIGIDNYFSGLRCNTEELTDEFPGQCEFLDHDVRLPFRYRIESWTASIDEIYHLACPASPIWYAKDPLYTLETAVMGTRNALAVGLYYNAPVLVASTSEIYGDPLETPQREEYYGNVNTMGARSCYDEGKRASETLAYIFGTQYAAKIRVARVFNTYGPRMSAEDGRVVSAFLEAALSKKPYPVFGEGTQTRSFCYVSDLVTGLIRLCRSDISVPINLGNPHEIPILELARTVHALCGTGEFRVCTFPPLQNDPKRRRPDISKARQLLGWNPQITLQEGLRRMLSSKLREKVEKEVTSKGAVPAAGDRMTAGG